MDLSEYLQLIRRSWVMIVASTLIGLLLASVYLLVTPKQFDATATLLVAANDQSTVADAAAAVQLTQAAASTYAVLIGSASILQPAAGQLNPAPTLTQLRESVVVNVRAETSAIDVTGSSADPTAAANIANAVADSASRIAPALDEGSSQSPVLAVRIVERAVPATAPVAPSTRGVLLIGAILGIVAGVVIALMRQALDKRLRSPEDVRRTTSAPVLALLPRTRRRGRVQGIAVREDPMGAIGEAFRSLRTVISTLDTADRRCIVVTSAGDDQSAAFVASNLAWSIAQAGHSVALIDTDLRKSAVAEAFQFDGSVGLADYLSKRTGLSGIVRVSDNDRLYLIGSGTTTSNPADLLSGQLFVSALQALENDFDYVVMSAPPLLSYTDGAIVARLASHTVVVASSARITAPQLSATIDALESVKVVAAGVVLTDALGAVRANRRLRGFRDKPQSGQFATVVRDADDDRSTGRDGM